MCGNEITHGLISAEGMFRSDALYARWLLLRYCHLSVDCSKLPTAGSLTGAVGEPKLKQTLQ